MWEPLRVIAATAVRVKDFLKAHPFGDAAADLVAARFAEKVSRAQALLTQWEAGRAASKAGTRHRGALRQAMNVDHVQLFIRQCEGANLLASSAGQSFDSIGPQLLRAIRDPKELDSRSSVIESRRGCQTMS